MNDLTTLQQISVLVLPVLFAITLHEAAHGWMAGRLGDATARMLGRVTLNPIRHIDPVGTLLVPVGTFLLTGFLFGWAKPVPVTWNNLRQPRRDMALVAFAGPAANLLMLLLWALVLKLATLLLGSSEWIARPLMYMGSAGVLINAILMVLNLLPIPLLDGGQIAYQVAEMAKGSPVSEKVQAVGNSLGLALLVMFMGLAFYNDIVGL